MNIVDAVGFEGVLNDTDDAATQVKALVSRMELFRGSLMNQLRKEPTVFFANPTTDTETVAGAKPGDVAVWVDEKGFEHFKILGVTTT